MKHSSVVTLDTMLRHVWYNQGPFGLSSGLHTSAKLKHTMPSKVYQQEVA